MRIDNSPGIKGRVACIYTGTAFSFLYQQRLHMSMLCKQCDTVKELAHFAKVERKKKVPMCNSCVCKNSDIMCIDCHKVLNKGCFSKEEYKKFPSAQCNECRRLSMFSYSYQSDEEYTGAYMGHGEWDTLSGWQEGPYDF